MNRLLFSFNWTQMTYIRNTAKRFRVRTLYANPAAYWHFWVCVQACVYQRSVNCRYFHVCCQKRLCGYSKMHVWKSANLLISSWPRPSAFPTLWESGNAVKTERPLLSQKAKNQFISIFMVVQNLSSVPQDLWGWNTLFWPARPRHHPRIIISFPLTIEMERNFNIAIYLLQETPTKVIGFISRKLIPHSLPHLVWFWSQGEKMQLTSN